VTTAVVLVLAGLAGWGVVLTGQGLDRAEKWISIVGVCLSTLLGLAGLVLAWLTWRQGQPTPTPPPTVHTPGPGAVGIGGDNQGTIRTEATGTTTAAPSLPAPGPGISASGIGSVAIGGTNTAPVHTKVTGPGTSGTP